MTIPNSFAFTPANGLRDTSTYPTVPASEADLRNAVQTPSDQLRDFMNGSILPSLGTSMNLTGATAATRYVGGTTSGAPTTGTFAVGDFVIDQSGFIWICKVAGSPGTWGKPTPHFHARVGVYRGNTATTSTTNNIVSINTNGNMPFQFTSAEWTSTTFYAEFNGQITGTGTSYFGIYDVTASAPVSGSEVSIATSNTIRSGSFTLVDGHKYIPYLRSSVSSVTTTLFSTDILQLI